MKMRYGEALRLGHVSKGVLKKQWAGEGQQLEMKRQKKKKKQEQETYQTAL